MTERSIATTIHGRYLVAAPAAPASGPARLVVGFHGYGEPVARMLERLRAIPGTDDAVHCAVQGLHRFYRGRDEEVVASWMTRQDREQAIADNLAYVAAVADAVRREFPAASAPVFAGFSQGVAMAFRAAAAAGATGCRGVLAVGGDVPPELRERDPLDLPPVLLACGTADDWYGPARLEHDAVFLRGRGVPLETLVFEGGHAWSEAFAAAAGRFLAGRRPDA